jgi:hypothetical protein
MTTDQTPDINRPHHPETPPTNEQHQSERKSQWPVPR